MSRTYAVADRLVIEVVDEFRPGDGGRWELHVGSDGASCEPTTESADLTIGAAELGSIYLGGFAPSTFAAAGLIDEHTPAPSPAPTSSSRPDRCRTATRASSRRGRGSSGPWAECPQAWSMASRNLDADRPDDTADGHARARVGLPAMRPSEWTQGLVTVIWGESARRRRRSLGSAVNTTPARASAAWAATIASMPPGIRRTPDRSTEWRSRPARRAVTGVASVVPMALTVWLRGASAGVPVAASARTTVGISGTQPCSTRLAEHPPELLVCRRSVHDAAVEDDHGFAHRVTTSRIRSARLCARCLVATGVGSLRSRSSR